MASRCRRSTSRSMALMRALRKSNHKTQDRTNNERMKHGKTKHECICMLIFVAYGIDSDTHGAEMQEVDVEVEGANAL
jgi:hypothetical protein